SAAKTVAARSRDLAEVLDHALRFHERHGDGDCPVCGRAGALTAKWHGEKAAQARELRDAARDVDAAQRQMADARAQAQRLPAPRAELIDRAPALGPEVARAADAPRSRPSAGWPRPSSRRGKTPGARSPARSPRGWRRLARRSGERRPC